MAPTAYGLWGPLLTTRGWEMNIDMELLAEQKQILLETIWDIEEQDRRYKLWGIVELIDHIQDMDEGK